MEKINKYVEINMLDEYEIFSNPRFSASPQRVIATKAVLNTLLTSFADIVLAPI